MKQVLVTRALADANRTATELEIRGFRAVVAPVTWIVATGASVPSGTWDALIVTSAHAAEALASLPDRTLPVFAVGPRTADAVRASGLTVLRVAEGDARSLSGLIRREVPAASRLLHVTTIHRKDEPEASLRAAGYEICSWDAYEAEAVERLPAGAEAALRAGRIDAALQYSRRSVEIMLRLAGEAELAENLKAFPHLCLSEDVAEPLRANGFEVQVAAFPQEPALLDLLHP